MRRTLALGRTGLSVAAAVVLLSSCGGSGDNTASSSSSARSSASETSARAAGSDFCTKAADTLSSVEPALSGSENDPAKLGPALQQAADSVRSIDPPSEISSAWASLADGIEQIAQVVTEEGTSEPAAASAQARIGAIIAQLTTAAGKVQTYLSDKCGLETSTDTASPTS